MNFTTDQSKAYSKLSPFSKLAITAYVKVSRLEKRLEKAQEELDAYFCKVPECEIGAYVELTEQINQEEKE